MISFDEALALVLAEAQPLGRERVALASAAGRVLAASVTAAIDSPRADVSAMDGYAVRDADLGALPARLTVIGKSLPGAVLREQVERGTCVRIFTGAPIPSGADRIVVQEIVRREGEHAIIDKATGPKTWIRPRGADFRSGDLLLPPGRVLDASALIAAAGADLADVEVFRRPRLALLSTGDELVQPGEARRSALAVPDSVSPGIAALAAEWGGMVVATSRLRDDLEAMRRAACRAIEATDVVVVTGGASVGERDFGKAMFETMGLELCFSRIAMRPGMPAWFGRVGNKRIVGLPGNPTSALVTARLLLAPLIAGMVGRSPGEAGRWEICRLASPLGECDARETFHRAILDQDSATPIAFQESHAQKALADANALIRQPGHSPAMSKGASVRVLRLNW